MMSRDEYLELLIKQVKFPFDRKAIRKEYSNHIEDCLADFIEDGLSLEQAEHAAIEAMGDPVETGKLLNRVHRPLLGWIHFISKVVMIALIASVIITTGPSFYEVVKDNLFSSQKHLTDHITELDAKEHRKLNDVFEYQNTRYVFSDCVLTEDNMLVLFYNTSRVNKLNYTYRTLVTNTAIFEGTIGDDSFVMDKHREVNGFPKDGLNKLFDNVSLMVDVYHSNELIIVFEDITSIPDTIEVTLGTIQENTEHFVINIKGVKP